MKKVISLSLLMVLLMFLMASCKSQKSTTSNKRAAKSTFVAKNDDKNKEKTNAAYQPAETTSTNTNQKTSATTADVKEEKVDFIEDTYNQEHHPYHVIVGSFSKISNATGLLKTLQSEKYQASMVQNEAGMYRVIIFSCSTYDEAKKRIASIKQRFPDAWILYPIR